MDRVEELDQNDLKRLKEDLREAREKYQILIKRLNEGVLIEDSNNQITFINNKAAKILGYSETELLGKPVNHIVPAEELYKFESDPLRIWEGGSKTFECRLLTKDSRRISVILTTAPITSNNSEFNGLLSVFTDLSKLKQTEEKLQRSEDRYHLLVDAIPDAVVLLDPDANIQLVNQQTVVLYGYKTKFDLISTNFYDLIDPNNYKHALDCMTQTLRRKVIRDVKLNMLRKNESFFPAEMTIKLITDDFERPEGYIVVIKDITERLKVLEAKQRLEDKRREFMDTAAHELRTPLTIIQGYTELLMKQEKELGNIRVFNTILKNVSRLEDLSSNVSDIYKVERGKFTVVLEKVDLRSFLTSFLEPYFRLYEGQIFWVDSGVTSDILVRGDANRLKNVFSNVLDNSIRNTTKKTRQITVKLEVFEYEVKIKVTDNGAGIKHENLEKIFEKFVTFPTTLDVTGTGIGLYISREIIDAHSGTISAYSEGVDTGATITITLPRGME